MARYGRVKVVVRDDFTTDQTLSDLDMLGFQSVRRCSDVKSMTETLSGGLVDILIYDYDSTPDELPAMLQKIRRRSAAKNPFVIVIATSTDTRIDTVKKLIDAGIDHLLCKPFTMKTLTSVIEAYTEARKPFVVNYKYVGPTRRAAKRDIADAVGLAHVPNTLRSKVVQNLDDHELQRMVDVALCELDDKQLEARANEIYQCSKEFAQTEELEKRQQLLDRIVAVSRELHQISEGSLSSQIGNLLKILMSLAVRIEKTGEYFKVNQIQLLGKLSQAICRAVTVERDAVELIQEMVETVSRAGLEKGTQAVSFK